MASVEPYFTSSGAARYKGIPWDAVNQKKGPTKSFHYESDALAYAKAWEKDRDGFAESLGLDPERNRTRILVTEYAMRFAKQMPGTPNTRRNRLSIARQIAKRWPSLYIHEISRESVKDYVVSLQTDLQPPLRKDIRQWALQKGLDVSPRRAIPQEILAAYPGKGKPMAPGTVRRYVTFLSTMFAEAVRDGIIPQSPYRDLPSVPRVTVREHCIPTEGELKAIIASMPDWMEAPILLAHDAGLRAAEVCGLRWLRIDFDKAEATVKDVLELDGELRHYPKGKEKRVVPLSDRTLAALKRLRMRQRRSGPGDFVLQRPIGNVERIVNPHQLCDWWAKNIVKVSELRDWPTFHDLRHACARRLAATGIEIQDLRDFMGHKSIETTAVYMPKGNKDRMRAALQAAPTFTGDAEVIELRTAQ